MQFRHPLVESKSYNRYLLERAGSDTNQLH